jgi:RNA polymerase sigma factor (sigma-70 family)
VLELPELPERDLVVLSDALTGLETFDARMSQVVELRFFGGLTVTETAQVLNVSPETVMRDWKTAKAWLLREIRRGQATASR